MVEWNGGMEWWNRKFSKNEAIRSHSLPGVAYAMRIRNYSDLMASLAHSFTEVKVSKLGTDLVASR